MKAEPRRELHLFFARENDSAVILYRARNDLYRLISWDTKTDQFVPGQWLKSRVYETESALSPDGCHFVYAAISKGSSDSFVAISKPPYFTAVAYFPNLTTFDLGGFFVDNKTIALKLAADGKQKPKLDCGLWVDRRTDYWPRVGTPYDETLRLRQSKAARYGQPAEVLARYHTEGGALYRKAPRGDQLIQDFSGMMFEPVIAPYTGVQNSRAL